MSLLPNFLNDTYFGRPSRMANQHFGLVLEPEDLLQPQIFPSMLLRCPAGYIRSWKPAASEKDSGSTVTYGIDKFLANLDVQQFQPDEITVKITGENDITVEGKHEEKEDQHGHIYRHFVRRYKIPKNYDISKIESKLSSDGVLSVSAPRINGKQVEHKSIPITQTGEPAKVEDMKCDGDKKCHLGVS